MRRRGGFTLIELLIAMAISAVVLAMAISVFRRQERSYALQNEVSERQQNVRVAMDMIVRDLRLAGHGTGFQVGSNLDLDGDGNADSLIVSAVDNMAPATDDIADGSDVVTIVYGRLPHTLDAGEFAQGNNIVLTSLDLDGDGFADFGLGGGGAWPMKFGVIYDLSHGTAFQVTAVAGGTMSTNPAVGNFPPGAYVSPLNVVRYWIDNEPNHGTDDALDRVMPRLMRRNFGRDTGPETVAENITGLQLQYGVDRDHNGQIDAWVNDFSQPTDRPEDVRAVRVWVMGQNPTPRPGHVDQLNANMGNVVVGPAPLFVRQVLNSQVELRNRP
jgi:prepilin-type N-terminal cleavage/methylation domain-containing protein